MYWAQHGDDTHQCSPRKYKACSSVYVVNWKLSYCDFKCKVPSAVWSAPHGCAKAYIPKVPIFSLRHLLCNTWPDVLFFLSYFIFDLIWFHSDVDKLGSNRKQSPQASTEANKGNVTLWVISALFMNSAQFRVALNSLINWLFKRNSVTFSFLSLFCIVIKTKQNMDQQHISFSLHTVYNSL